VSLPPELELALSKVVAPVEKLDSGWIFNCDNRLVFEALPDNSIDLIITDPPYKDYQSNRPVKHEKVKKILESDFDLPYFIEQSARVLKPGSHFYCWCDHLTFPGIVMEMKKQKDTALAHPLTRSLAHFLTYKNMLVWVKNNHGSGDLKGNYAPQHELVIFGCKGEKGRKLRGKRQPNVYFKTNRAGGIEFYGRVSNYDFGHGTSKPVDIQRLMIEASTDEDEVVLDCYGGSMSVGEATRLTDRKFLLVELEDEHFRNGTNRLSIDQGRLI
jgi:site-specific DNA-methyltransferase (adenine-specific)